MQVWLPVHANPANGGENGLLAEDGKLLRDALYMPALVAIRFNHDMKDKYEHFKAAGKPSKVAITAIMRKLIILANALVKDDRKWHSNGRAGPQALPDDPGEVFADSACRGRHLGDAVRAGGGIPRIVATGLWGRDEAEVPKRLKAWNQPIHRGRGRIGKILGTWKRRCGPGRMRWPGLARAAARVRPTAIACNPERTLNITTRMS